MNDTKEALIKGKFYVDRGKPDVMLGKSKIKNGLELTESSYDLFSSPHIAKII